MRSLIIVGAFSAFLSGCGTTSNVTSARNEMANTCAVDVQDEPFVNVGHGLITGSITAEMNREIAERNTARRQAARANQPSYCPPDVPRTNQAAAPKLRTGGNMIVEQPADLRPLPLPPNPMSVTFGPNGQAHPCMALGPSMTACN